MFNSNILDFIPTSYSIRSGRTVYTRGYRSQAVFSARFPLVLGFRAMLVLVQNTYFAKGWWFDKLTTNG